jgi:hypothetical protein
MRQFGSGSSYKTTKLTGNANASGEPLYGPPRGFGLKQLDNWGTTTNPKQATEQHLWSWKENIKGGVEVIEEKKAAVNRARKKNDEIIANWNKDNSHNKVSDSMYIKKGKDANSTVLTIKEGNIIFAVNPTGAQKDVYDARWIKMFNSGNADLYYQVLQKDEKTKPTRVVNRSNAANKNYVDEVCAEPD